MIVKKEVLGMADIAIPLEEYKKYNMTRQQAAIAAMQGMLANPNIIMTCGCLENNQEYIIKHAVMYADALLAELNGKGGSDERNNN